MCCADVLHLQVEMQQQRVVASGLLQKTKDELQTTIRMRQKEIRELKAKINELESTQYSFELNAQVGSLVASRASAGHRPGIGRVSAWCLVWTWCRAVPALL